MSDPRPRAHWGDPPISGGRRNPATAARICSRRPSPWRRRRAPGDASEPQIPHEPLGRAAVRVAKVHRSTGGGRSDRRYSSGQLGAVGLTLIDSETRHQQGRRTRSACGKQAECVFQRSGPPIPREVARAFQRKWPTGSGASGPGIGAKRRWSRVNLFL